MLLDLRKRTGSVTTPFARYSRVQGCFLEIELGIIIELRILPRAHHVYTGFLIVARPLIFAVLSFLCSSKSVCSGLSLACTQTLAAKHVNIRYFPALTVDLPARLYFCGDIALPLSVLLRRTLHIHADIYMRVCGGGEAERGAQTP